MVSKLPNPAPPEIVDAFIARLGAGAVSVADHDRWLYARDMYPVALMHHAEGSLRHFPDLIVHPADTEEVVAVIDLARSFNMPVIPFGAGSGVCGGTMPIRGGVMLDLKRMHRVLEVNDRDLTVRAQAGIMGQTLEMELNRRDYTMGHFPSSIHCSTLGGWVAARSAGQCSSKYGKIEDMVLGLEFVLPDGSVVRTPAVPHGGAGPSWQQIVIGSEGTMGVVTEATCRIWPAPAQRRFLAYEFSDVRTGIEAMRLVMQNDLRPAAMRLYDPLDTLMVGKGGAEESGGSGMFDFIPVQQIETRLRTLLPRAFRKTQRFLAGYAEVGNRLEKLSKGECLMVLMFEGETRLTDYEFEATQHLCDRLGGINRGPEPAMKWFRNRHHVSYKMSKVFYNGAFVDTIEVATSWTHLPALYDAVRAAIRPMAFVMAHFSHAYPDGGSIYFTFVSSAPDATEGERKHRAIWHAALTAAMAAKATISHHHGIGLSKGEYLRKELGELFPVFETLKSVMDADNRFNPGKLGLA